MDKTLRQLQLTQLEILRVFDRFCRDHGLRYSLYAGSLLGAVRHKGFIPWDDDLDVCMSRTEYNRFISLWSEQGPSGYILQNKENSPRFPQSFSKIRKNHTTFLQSQGEARQYHTGIFLDIFPLDRMPNGKIERYIFLWHCMKYQLLTREFVPPKSSALIRFLASILLACIPKTHREAARQRVLIKITRYADCHELNVAAIETMASLRKTYSPNMLDSYIELPFEDGEFMCFAGWDDHLQRKFGNYMEFPPEEERHWKHHPVLIDFEHNYEELDIRNE